MRGQVDPSINSLLQLSVTGCLPTYGQRFVIIENNVLPWYRKSMEVRGGNVEFVVDKLRYNDGMAPLSSCAKKPKVEALSVILAKRLPYWLKVA